MKTLRITLLVSAAVLVASSFAQTSGTVKNQIGLEKSGKNHDLTKRALHMAVEEINKGLKALREGLPIYQGHRVNAIDLGVLAKSEILVGLLEQRLDNHAKALQREMDNDSPRKYSDQQIQRSNEKLVIGGHHFENALGILTRTNWDYEGHKTASMIDLRKALDEIRAALAPYGGPSRFMPKGGFKDGNGQGGRVITP
jgi:hypothetical protein